MSRTLRTRPGSPTDVEPALRVQLERAEAQLATVRQQLRQTQQLASLGAAATMLAHEFNNLMTPMVAYARFALDSDDDALRVKALEMTLKQTAVITAMSDRIVRLAVNKPLAPESVGLGEVVEESVASLCRDLSKDGITLKISIDDSLKVWADAKHLQQVFFNLLLNARRALDKRKGRITIQAEPIADRRIRIEFRDTGCGIPGAELDHIFDPFVTSKGNGSGSGAGVSGLGLTICRELVHEHGGTISAASTEGKGTTFTIELPIAEQD